MRSSYSYMKYTPNPLLFLLLPLSPSSLAITKNNLYFPTLFFSPKSSRVIVKIYIGTTTTTNQAVLLFLCPRITRSDCSQSLKFWLWPIDTDTEIDGYDGIGFPIYVFYIHEKKNSKQHMSAWIWLHFC